MGRRRAKVGGGGAALKELLLRGKEAAGVIWGSVELVSSVLEKVEDIVEAIWVELEATRKEGRCGHEWWSENSKYEPRTSTP